MEIKSATTDVMAKTQQDYADLTEAITAKQNEINTAISTVNSLKQQQEEAGFQLTSINGIIEACNKNLDSINFKINSANEELAQVQSELLITQNKNNDLATANDNSQKNLTALMTAISDKQNELDALIKNEAKQKFDVEAQIDLAAGRLVDLQAQQNQLLIANQIFAEQNKKANDELLAKIDKSNEADSKIQNVNKELAAIEKQTEDAQANLVMIVDQTNGANISFNNIKEQIVLANKDLDLVNQQITDAKVSYEASLSKMNNLAQKSDYLLAMEANIKQKYEKIGEQYQPFAA